MLGQAKAQTPRLPLPPKRLRKDNQAIPSLSLRFVGIGRQGQQTFRERLCLDSL